LRIEYPSVLTTAAESFSLCSARASAKRELDRL